LVPDAEVFLTGWKEKGSGRKYEPIDRTENEKLRSEEKEEKRRRENFCLSSSKIRIAD
jgi:hypothetical protein